VPLICRLPRVLHTDRSFIRWRRNHKQDTNLSNKTEVDQMLSLAVTLWTTLEIISQLFWCQPPLSLTYHMTSLRFTSADISWVSSHHQNFFTTSLITYSPLSLKLTGQWQVSASTNTGDITVDTECHWLASCVNSTAILGHKSPETVWYQEITWRGTCRNWTVQVWTTWVGTGRLKLPSKCSVNSTTQPLPPGWFLGMCKLILT
jgi:hypothetical protein